MKFPRHGTAGIALILASEFLLFSGVKIVGVFFTPLVWTGYVLFVDALNLRLNGSSLITSRPREFLAMLPWSAFCWLLFEAYNLRLRNWEYVGLPEDPVIRWVGYLWSFATIFPAVLETAEVFGSFIPERARNRTRSQASPRQGGRIWNLVFMLFGTACLIVPLLVSQGIAAGMFALVWVGFVPLLDPVNRLLGGRSLILEIQSGSYRRCFALVVSGITCGVLWEFWNFWAVARWHYMVPLSFAGPKIFEMPLLGFAGFIPFAFECFVMQEFLLGLAPGLRSASPTSSTGTTLS